MTIHAHRQFLMSQIVQLQELAELAQGSALMYPSLTHRLDVYQKQLAALPVDRQEAKVVLYFWGKPAKGSQGLDIDFVSKVLPPYKSMVATDYANTFHGGVGERGALTSSEEAKMYLTALPRGSFGVELSKLEEDNLFDTAQLAESIAHITTLVAAAVLSDEAFLAETENTAGRTLKCLKDFLDEIKKFDAGFAIESGSKRIDVSEEQARIAADRVNVSVESRSETLLVGTNGGLQIERRSLEIIEETLGRISVKVPSEFLSQRPKSEIRNSEDKRCKVLVSHEKITFPSGQERNSYTLLQIPELITE